MYPIYVPVQQDGNFISLLSVINKKSLTLSLIMVIVI